MRISDGSSDVCSSDLSAIAWKRTRRTKSSTACRSSVAARHGRRSGTKTHPAPDGSSGDGGKLMRRPPRLFECRQVGDRRPGDSLQRLFGEKTLMARDQHIGEGEQPGENIVLDHLGGHVLEDTHLSSLIDVQPQQAKSHYLHPAAQGGPNPP